MSFSDYLKRYSTINTQFLDDYSSIFKENYNEDTPLINSKILQNWLKLSKTTYYIAKIKENLRLNIDYIEKKVDKKGSHGGQNEKVYFLTPTAAKKFCMISKSPVAEEVRQYFIDVEKNYKNYILHVNESMQQKNKELMQNQKPKVSPEKGIIYVFRALDAEGENLFKIGRTISSKTRFNSYNSGLANNLEILMSYETDKPKQVETCVKTFMKDVQYRKYKEIYEVDLNIIRKTIEQCDKFSGKFTYMVKNQKKKPANYKNVKEGDKLFMMIPGGK